MEVSVRRFRFDYSGNFLIVLFHAKITPSIQNGSTVNYTSKCKLKKFPLNHCSNLIFGGERNELSFLANHISNLSIVHPFQPTKSTFE
ncbi:uncharacterized protein BYT42DRAFT_557184 [Radiomyces spectabilis]|uniref:uncharacterized protein n=1 Tax=Radiomyces spectabilis TaxID=64574 RepID=UPI00221EB68E|nr:uncharacterized protein BYT42DRAFT_557184 [Radiomyces spectabilis]KAI8391525.1 hypothetical protein BYT42DRAFT_557184 [Radiomyces spectabilis]